MARFVLVTEQDCREVPLSGEATYTIPLGAKGFQFVHLQSWQTCHLLDPAGRIAVLGPRGGWCWLEQASRLRSDGSGEL